MDSDKLLQTGVPIIESWLIPRDQVYAGKDFAWRRDATILMVHPATMMSLMNGGRFPLWTRNSLGVIEAERDRRKHGRRDQAAA